jgi:hypothetical protein
MTDAPLLCRWDGEAMVPASQFWARRADKQWVVGEVYHIVERHDRSQASHNQEFAAIGEMWKSLPERYADEPWAQSADHLRKFALIRKGYCNTQTYACGSRAEAERWAQNLRPLDEYSIVTVEGSTVYRFTAQSQSRRAMGKQLFQESKTAILEFIEDLIGVDRGSSADARAA